MIEVFKTNVKGVLHAQIILDQLREVYGHYAANFDLEDRDKILRIKCNNDIDPASIINFLKALDCQAEILPDIIQVTENRNSCKGN